MSLTAPFLSLAAPLPKLLAHERYLFIGPHPDDIEVGCAPTVRRLTELNKEVRFLIVTDGRMGSVTGLSGGELVSVRQAEAKRSAALLGVPEENVRFLPFHDGGMYPMQDAAKAIALEIAAFRADVIFAPDADVKSECHLDHIKVGQAAKFAVNMAPYAPIMRGFGTEAVYAPKALALYFTDKPNAFIRTGKRAKLRREALSCHESQFSGCELNKICSYFTLRSIKMGLHCFALKADGYRALSPVHWHCFPEAGEIYGRCE